MSGGGGGVAHLDRLADQGRLAVEYRRPPGRSGPGAGRPAKLYRRTEDELAVSVPERHYDLIGGLLAAAVAESIDTGAGLQEVLHRTAYDASKIIGAAAGNLVVAVEVSASSRGASVQTRNPRRLCRSPLASSSSSSPPSGLLYAEHA